MSELQRDVDTRRTFAIISHPDAGKTTMTEKLLLLGQAIQVAGSVKGKRGPHATSDWMALEQERGISVTSSVMQFPYRDRWVNLLDTPGHEDFSEDTYRTLTAVDSALMVIDGAKGVEDRTIKLMNVCRLRDTPIMTFVNKLDRDIRDPIDLVDEVEEVLGIAGCTNGRIEDLRLAAELLKGKKIASNVSAMVVPGSGLVKAQAEKEGIDKIFINAGFEWREPGCSMCLGMNPDQLKPKERCASTSNRNFEGRQGRGGRTHLVSPGMAVAAAIKGHLSDVREIQ